MIGVWINSARLNNYFARSRFGSWKVRRLKQAIDDDDDDENGIIKKWTGFKKCWQWQPKKKSTTTAKIGKRKEKEQIAISPAHRSRESLVTVMRARRIDLLRSPHPTPPWHILSEDWVSGEPTCFTLWKLNSIALKLSDTYRAGREHLSCCSVLLSLPRVGRLKQMVSCSF